MPQQTNYMEHHLIRFVHVLRHLGVRVSAAEAIDSIKALGYVQLMSRPQVKQVLSATLTKSQHDQKIFEQAFESYFVTPEERARRLQARQEKQDVEREEMAQADQELVFWNDELEEDGSYDPSPTQLNLSREQKRTYTKLPKEAREKLREYLKNQMEGNDVNNPRNLLESVVRGQLEYWKRKLAQQEAEAGSGQMLEAELTGDDAFDEILEHVVDNFQGEETILHEDMKNIADKDLDRVGVIIRKLSRKLATKISRRYRQSQKKQVVDIRRTVRHNIRYGGTLLQLKHRTRRIERPKLVLLCDVSGSMARYAGFILQFIYGLSSAVSRIESFVFAEELERVSEHFRNPSSFEDTMRKIMNESTEWGRGTNLGAALDELLGEYGKKLTSESIVILVSDGKTMGVDYSMESIRRLKTRCKDILWLNTLPRTEWEQVKGLKNMGKYAKMFECYTLAHLEKILSGHIIQG